MDGFMVKKLPDIYERHLLRATKQDCASSFASPKKCNLDEIHYDLADPEKNPQYTNNLRKII
jgi:hypothetical protein